MTLYYSAGDGLGHLTRSLALIKQLQLQQVHLLHTTTMDISGRENILKTIALKKGQIPYHLFQKAKTLYLDSFPVGLTGTLQPYLYGTVQKVVYVARLLNWKSYSKHLNDPLPYFNETFLMEPLVDDHAAFIKDRSDKVRFLNLEYPCYANPELPFQKDPEKELWMIVHSGPIEEVKQLVDYALDLSQLIATKPKIWLVSPASSSVQHPWIYWSDTYPAYPYFPLADRIFTGCGFNSMQQTLPFQAKHHFVPFERRYDNQFERARRRRLNFTCG